MKASDLALSPLTRAERAVVMASILISQDGGAVTLESVASVTGYSRSQIFRILKEANGRLDGLVTFQSQNASDFARKMRLEEEKSQNATQNATSVLQNATEPAPSPLLPPSPSPVPPTTPPYIPPTETVAEGGAGGNEVFCNTQPALFGALTLQEPAPAKSGKAKKVAKSQAAKLTDAEWYESLKSEPLFAGVNIDHEKAQAEFWISRKQGRLFTRRFFENWLKKAAQDAAQNAVVNLNANVIAMPVKPAPPAPPSPRIPKATDGFFQELDRRRAEQQRLMKEARDVAKVS